MNSEAKQKNVFGEDIESCCENPITGFLGMDSVIPMREMKGFIQYA